jgi:iron complex outermembrane receptor protein
MMKHGMGKLAMLFCVAVTVKQAVAQELGTDELGDSSTLNAAIHPTRLDYSKFDSPEAVTVLTKEDIRSAGYLDISEIFRSVPGFRVVKIGDESRISYHGTAVRQNRRLRVTINGKNVLIGDGQYVEFDRLPIAVEDISRVVITRGTNGAAYGDNAFLANIDFQTVGRNDPHITAVRGGGGSNSRSKYSIATNEEFAGFNVSASLGGEYNGGYDYEDLNGTPRNDGKQVYRAQLTVSKAVTDRSVWDFNVSAYDSENQIGVLEQVGVQTNKGQFFELSNKWELGQSSRLDTSISHNHQQEEQRQYGCLTTELRNAWLGAIQSPSLRGQLQGAFGAIQAGFGLPLANICEYNDLDIESTRTDVEVEFQSRVGNWRYTAGASASRVDAESAQYFDGVDQRQETYRVFGETAYSFGAVNVSVGGMAQDSDNVADTEYAGRAAINWTVTPGQSLRYAYAEGFRVPSLMESESMWRAQFCFRRDTDPINSAVLCRGPGVITSTVVVEPEHISSHSVGYFGTFVDNAITIDVKAFHDEIRDPITSNYFFFTSAPRNDSSFTLQGVETETAFRVTEQWALKAQYSFLENDAVQTFEQGMQGRHAGSLGITFKPTLGHSVTTSYYANSDISDNDYSRIDVAYNYFHRLGKRGDAQLQVVYQHHISDVDGVGIGGPLGSNEGVYKNDDQIFAYLQVGF